jgi:hypothetical protein
LRVFVLSSFFPLRLRKPPVFEEGEDAPDADEDFDEDALDADEDAFLTLSSSFFITVILIQMAAASFFIFLISVYNLDRSFFIGSGTSYDPGLLLLAGYNSSYKHDFPINFAFL